MLEVYQMLQVSRLHRREIRTFTRDTRSKCTNPTHTVEKKPSQNPFTQETQSQKRPDRKFQDTTATILEAFGSLQEARRANFCNVTAYLRNVFRGEDAVQSSRRAGQQGNQFSRHLRVTTGSLMSDPGNIISEEHNKMTT